MNGKKNALQGDLLFKPLCREMYCSAEVQPMLGTVDPHTTCILLMKQSSHITDRTTTDYWLQWTKLETIILQIGCREHTFAVSMPSDNRLECVGVCVLKP